MSHPFQTIPAPILDTAFRALAWVASKVSPVTAAGAFWSTGGTAFVDAWAEPGSAPGRRSLTVRLGRLEVVVDTHHSTAASPA